MPEPKAEHQATTRVAIVFSGFIVLSAIVATWVVSSLEAQIKKAPQSSLATNAPSVVALTKPAIMPHFTHRPVAKKHAASTPLLKTPEPATPRPNPTATPRIIRIVIRETAPPSDDFGNNVHIDPTMPPTPKPVPTPVLPVAVVESEVTYNVEPTTGKRENVYFYLPVKNNTAAEVTYVAYSGVAVGSPDGDDAAFISYARSMARQSAERGDNAIPVDLFPNNGEGPAIAIPGIVLTQSENQTISSGRAYLYWYVVFVSKDGHSSYHTCGMLNWARSFACPNFG
jgi:hypothetical protein